MTAEALLTALGSAPFGAYAISVDQSIVFWNKAAERILGYSSQDVLGLRCFEVVSSVSTKGITPECLGGCPSIRYLRSGLVPSPARLSILCASGERKWVNVTPMVAAGAHNDGPLLLYLFDDPDGSAVGVSGGTVTPQWASGEAGLAADQSTVAGSHASPSALSRREAQVLQLVALGRDTPRIAADLRISRHTVRNHIRNLRQKLNASTKLEAVLTAMRTGILEQK